MQASLLEAPVENWRLLLKQSFTAHMQLLTTTLRLSIEIREKMLELSSAVE